MIFYKTILLNIDDKLKENFDKKYLELSALFYLFTDLEFVLAVNKDLIADLKVKFFNFSNVKIILKDSKCISYDQPSHDSIFDMQHIHSNINDGFEITTGGYWYQKELLDASIFINHGIENDKLIVYYLGESNVSYLYKTIANDLMNKLVNDLDRVNNSNNLIIVYKPQFVYTKNKLNLINQRIDDSIQIIRNFCFNYLHQQCRILYGANVTNENVLSFCVTNNLDGFAFEWDGNEVNEVLEFAKKVHGWQRIVVNQARRKIL